MNPNIKTRVKDSLASVVVSDKEEKTESTDGIKLKKERSIQDPATLIR